jgi:hypothetical protein
MSAHEDLSRREEMRASSDRVFGLVSVVLLAAIALGPVRKGLPPRWWAAALSAAFLIAAFVRPSLLHPLNRLWFRLALLLNKVINPILTGLLFYLVFTPMALLFRLTGRDPLRLHFDSDAKSYWLLRRPPGPPPETMVNQF